MRMPVSTAATKTWIGADPRSVDRVFIREVGATPGKYFERLRMDAARRRLAKRPRAQSENGLEPVSGEPLLSSHLGK